MTHGYGGRPPARELDRDLTELARRLERITVHILGPGGAAGSGTIWASGGLIITNAHVARGSSAVALSTGGRFRGRLVAWDPEADLAALAIGAAGLPAAEPGDSRALRAGDIVLATGNPLGLRGALTTGIVHTAPGRAPAGRFIQADLALLPGNSGGPLADARGRVVGITAMIAGRLALAVPETTIARFLTRLRDRMAAP
jgi:serine protease Do